MQMKLLKPSPAGEGGPLAVDEELILDLAKTNLIYTKTPHPSRLRRVTFPHWGRLFELPRHPVKNNKKRPVLWGVFCLSKMSNLWSEQNRNSIIGKWQPPYLPESQSARARQMQNGEEPSFYGGFHFLFPYKGILRNRNELRTHRNFQHLFFSYDSLLKFTVRGCL